MIDGYQFVKMSNSSIKDSEMVLRYASLGYFHYQYIKGLDYLNSCQNIAKDNGVIRGRGDYSIQDGSYLRIAVVDFGKKKRTSCLFRFEKHRLNMSVGEVLDLCEIIHRDLKVDDSNCFVKFDVYTIVN